MRIAETKVYNFDELSDEAKESAIENLWDINVDYEWWDSIYEDAANIGLKLTGFNIHRGSCEGEFTEDVGEVAGRICSNHGHDCPICCSCTAEDFLGANKEAWKTLPEKLDGLPDGFDENESEREAILDDAEEEFLRSLLEDYRITLRKEYEHLTSKEVVIETIKANGYEFTDDGKLF